MMRPALPGRLALLAAAALLAPRPAAAQLAEHQVLLIYDSRIPDSLAIAEYYAGSAKVPGGEGNLPGTRPGVHVLDLSTITGAGLDPPAPDISYSTYLARFRNPIRSHLAAADLAHSVRCLVLTKGLPHRVQDTDNAAVGDNPLGQSNEFNSGDATACSLDAELALLWQPLEAGENGNPADSRSDGMIVNPYHRRTLPICAWSTRRIRSAGTFTGLPGHIWQSNLTPGDIYLVCRLDGPTVADVRAALDRAAGRAIVADVETAAAVLDESNADGVAMSNDADGEYDNDGVGLPTDGGDDYELARDALLADGRWNPAMVRYDPLAGPANFSIGPNLPFDGEGLVVSDPVILLAHYGANHAGAIPGEANPGGDPSARTLYPESFTYAPGAVFNTIESYNGRALGGLGQNPFAAQGQASAFIAAGGTFALANVWEPFSISVPDNDMIVRNFLLGTLSWAEAAYTSLPVLSWQQIVLGDPLARITRTCDDVNADGAVDIEDLYAWVGSPTDLNRSGTADGADLALLEATLRAGEAALNAGAQR